ncbi:MAG: hypothetical protein ACC707_20780 [Thiohalomonadales bacterium]
MKKLFTLIFAGLLFLLSTQASFAENKSASLFKGPSFKAQMIESNKANPGVSKKSEVWMSKHGLRIATGGPGGQKMISLANIDNNYVLLPKQRKYISTTEIQQQADRTTINDGPVNMFSNKPCLGFAKSKMSHVDKVAGRKVTKWYCGTAQGLDDTVHYFDARLQRVIKVEQPDGTVLELVNIEQKPQDRKLFEIPPGYKKMTFAQMITPPGMNLETFTEEKK